MVSLTRDREAWRLGVFPGILDGGSGERRYLFCTRICSFLFTFMFGMFTFYDVACLKNWEAASRDIVPS